MNSFYDIAVVGAVIIGASQALALAQATSLRIALIDTRHMQPSWSPNIYDSRVSAITPTSQQFFHALNVWEIIACKRSMPFTHMTVWDAGNDSKIEFDHNNTGQSELGYIVENNAIQDSLMEHIQHDEQIDYLPNLTLDKLAHKETHLELLLHSAS